MTLGKILSPISLTFSLALTSTVLTACGEGAGIKIECSRPQDAFNASCLDANDLASIDNRLTQCLRNENAHDSCTNLIAVNTGDISGYDALPATLATLPTGDTTGFVKITGSTITTTGLTTPTTGGASLPNSATNGYSYAVGTNGAIAGILPDTDLGAPVFARTGTANWTGTYSMPTVSDTDSTDGVDTMTINFAINFGERTMKGNAETITPSVNLTTDTRFTEYGAITGTFRVNRLDSNNNQNPITGSVMGLIGTQGTVGVFHGTNNAVGNTSATSHAGGFIATPPAP